MRVRSASAFAPATVANVGPGFDAFGFALEGPGDIVSVRRVARPGVRILRVDGADITRVASRNAAGVVAAAMRNDAGVPWGVDMVVEKGLPVGTGMGSSAASSAAAATAMNRLLGGGITADALVRYAALGERACSGAAHADNVAAALFGGFTVVTADGSVLGLPVPAGWTVAVVRPHLEMRTATARASLPDAVSFAAHASTAAGAGALVAALAARDIRRFGAAMGADAVVEPLRAARIPRFAKVRAAALAAGAYGVAVAGSGPSVVALTDSRRDAKVIAERMREAWRKGGVDTDTLVSRMGARGAQILERRSQ